MNRLGVIGVRFISLEDYNMEMNDLKTTLNGPIVDKREVRTERALNVNQFYALD